jgi:hypothetical protein
VLSFLNASRIIAHPCLSRRRFMLAPRALACPRWWRQLLLCCLLLAALSSVAAQSIAALHPSSVPAASMHITVFGSGFNVTRGYSCSISGPGGISAACPTTLPRSPTILECSCVPTAASCFLSAF